ncbi:MAG: cytochrome c oxidase subunit 4 [Cognaticolwellia sp.]|jgi:cytochrome c oxidase subunit 4
MNNNEHKVQNQQHPISMYLKIWLLLFVLSTLSYMVDYFQFQGLLRWTLILIFMFLKAGLIIMIFMHLSWERLSVKLLLFIPPLAIAVLITLMAIEADYTFINRLRAFLFT